MFMNPSLTSRTFGYLPSGESVEAWTISGARGLVAEVITYGAIISRLLVPGRDGRVTDVVLGFNCLESYLADRCYFGAVAGRIAGRITGACFNLEGKTFELARNDPPNHLHGGMLGLGRRLWTAGPIRKIDKPPAVHLTYKSPDGEDGYPGSVNIAVTYAVTDENVLLIQSEAVADRPTPLNLTFHSYFNLGGEGSGSIDDHELQIHSDQFVHVDEHMTLLGTLGTVADNNDFREPRRLGDAIPHLFQKHGDLYRIGRVNGEAASPELVPAARLVHHESGRALEVMTTSNYLQLYTGAALDGSVIGKSDVPYMRHAGVCLECEGYPDGANVPSMGNIILQPGRVQRETTAYAFF
jgi:aldose 1-epimerase